jgi:hypothetical protein
MFGAMTLEERLALAREIAKRTKRRFVIDSSRAEAKQKRYDKVKRQTKSAGKRKAPKR